MALHLCNVENMNEAAVACLTHSLPILEKELDVKNIKDNHLNNSLADVFPCEDHVAGPTSEAADVPLFLQRQERLALLDLGSTSSTVWREQRWGFHKKNSDQKREVAKVHNSLLK